MKLHPKRLPGRVDRKAAAYAADIAELRRAGYTYEAIREALLDVGVVASTSALRREVRRLHTREVGSALHPAPGPPASSSTLTASGQSHTPAPRPPPHDLPGGMHGREVAEAFFSTHISNPLLKSQETP
jgi:hypothetical protein